MSNLHSKRKYAGEPHKDKRGARAPDAQKLPPHKKPKVWTLTVRWAETTTQERTKAFPNKAARDEARARVERHFREEAERDKQQPRRYRYAGWFNSPLSGFDAVESKTLKAGPDYVEGYEDAPA
jgi:hypothetical protein